MRTSDVQRPPHRKSQRLRTPIARYLTAVALMVASVTSSASEHTYFVDDSYGITRADSSRVPNEDVESTGAGLFLKAKTSAQDAAEQIEMLTGYRPPALGACGHYEVGPLDAKSLGPKDFWLSLISPYVKIVRLLERQDSRPDVVANMWLGDKVLDFDIDRATRRVMIDKFPFKFGFLPNADQELREVDKEVGPIRGRMSINEALRIFIGSDDLMIRWLYEEELDPPYTVSVIPLHREALYADMSESECNFGYKELGRVTVTESRLPSLQDDVASPVEVFDRERIERSGVASIPELLRYATQSAFTPAPGHRMNGAQYAEGRGVGPAMVLIEGQRTMASVSSLEEAAFDLNTIPLAAVERVEFVPDGGSIIHGVDSVGGIVNIVLRRPTESLSSEARYGTARGGAIERRLTALARTESSSRDAVLIADQIEVTNLLGHTRSRYANQDYSRYEGGIDRRSITSEFGNLQSIDGENIPGFDSGIVGLPSPDGRENFDAGDLHGQPNLTSLLRYQSVSPARRRSSLVGIGKLAFDAIDISGNVIYTRQDTEYTLPPPSVIGALVASDHPQNSLHQPVLYYGLLTGIGSQRYETGTDFFRGALAFSAYAIGWDWDLSVAHTREAHSIALTNVLDPISLADSLNTDDQINALNFFAVHPGAERSDLLATAQPETFESEASHAHLTGERGFPLFPAGLAHIAIGVDWRREKLGLSEVDDNASRDAIGSYLNLRAPVLKAVSLSAGIRKDSYSDGNSVASSQFGFEWKPSLGFKVHGNFGERYSPPSLYELYATPMPFEIPVTDPKTSQTTIATVTQGGRPNLKPMTATSSGIGVVLTTKSDFDFSFYYWQSQIQDRISILPLQTTLEHEDVLPGRVIREPATIADSPGRIQSIDIGWQNLGEVEVGGVDIRMRKALRAWGGTLSSELGLTWNTKYRFRDLPAAVSPFTDRVGIAFELGTILRHRAVAEIAWENPAWRIIANVIEQPHYRDIELGDQKRATVSSQVLIDLSLSRRWGASSLTIGAANLFDSEPGYSNASVWGYDPSQGDLRGRFAYCEVRIGF